MDAQIIFWLKVFLLTEAVTHALRSWVILATLRDPIKANIDFMNQLLSCFECSAVWAAALVIPYLYFIDFWPLTMLLIVSRWANILHIAVDWIDALRASAINKI